MLDHPYVFAVLDANITVHVKYTNFDYSIPRDGSLKFHLDEGRINATCTDINDASRGRHTILLFHFSNTNGDATVVYDNIKGGVALQVLGFDLNLTTISLDYPQLLLPRQFLDDMLRSAVNSSTVVANAFLYDTPYVLPFGLKARVPNPAVAIKNQPGCCFDKHGYLEITSACYTSNPIGNLYPCSALPPLPTIAPSSSASSVLQASTARQFEAQTQSDTLYLTAYTSKYNQQGCKLDHMGDSAILLQLSDTYGFCQSLTYDDPSLQTAAQGDLSVIKYSMQTHVDGSVNMRLYCSDALCQTCAFTLRWNTSSADQFINRCLSASLGSQQVNLLLQPGSSTCLGPTSPVNSPQSMFLQQFGQSTSCTIAPVSQFTPATTVLTNIGPWNSVATPVVCNSAGFQVSSFALNSYDVDGYCPTDGIRSSSWCQYHNCTLSVQFSVSDASNWPCVNTQKYSSYQLPSSLRLLRSDQVATCDYVPAPSTIPVQETCSHACRVAVAVILTLLAIGGVFGLACYHRLYLTSQVGFLFLCLRLSIFFSVSQSVRVNFIPGTRPMQSMQ
jgi:hypothetical protein